MKRVFIDTLFLIAVVRPDDPWSASSKRAFELTRPDVTVVPQSRDTLLRALDRYEARPDKSYSLTDCAAMNAMDDHGIREVLTSDRHFEQEGYTILIKR